MSAAVLGAIIAGGRSTRYGRPKALECVAGVRLVDRVLAALRPVTGNVVMIANDASIADAAGLPWRSDTLPELGALGGIYTALLWAHEKGSRGVLAVACDMPFVSEGLLRRIVEQATTTGADVVIPESGGRRGVEPLCAFYAISCIPAIEQRAAEGDHRMIGFYDLVSVTRIPLAEAEQFGSAARLFLNVNTPEDRARAEVMAREPM